MNFNFHITQPLLSLIAGIVILVQPKFLSWAIGIWLVLNGIIGLGLLRL